MSFRLRSCGQKFCIKYNIVLYGMQQTQVRKRMKKNENKKKKAVNGKRNDKPQNANANTTQINECNEHWNQYESEAILTEERFETNELRQKENE